MSAVRKCYDGKKAEEGNKQATSSLSDSAVKQLLSSSVSRNQRSLFYLDSTLNNYTFTTRLYYVSFLFL